MPYRSKAQWRWGAAHFRKAKHEQWVKESPPYSELPEKAPNEQGGAVPRSQREKGKVRKRRRETAKRRKTAKPSKRRKTAKRK